MNNQHAIFKIIDEALYHYEVTCAPSEFEFKQFISGCRAWLRAGRQRQQLLTEFPFDRKTLDFWFYPERDPIDTQKEHKHRDLHLEVFLHELFRKCKELDTCVDPVVTTLESWYKREGLNRIVNQKLKDKVMNPQGLLLKIKRYIAAILTEEVPEVTPVFTTGATTTLKSGNLPHQRLHEYLYHDALWEYLESQGYNDSPRNVYQRVFHCEYNVRKNLKSFDGVEASKVYYKRISRDGSYVSWEHGHPVVRRGMSRGAIAGNPLFVPRREVNICNNDKAFLVDKDWKSKRFIALPPACSVAWQRGVGVAVRERLKAFGYDIPKLASIHGQLALMGSRTNSLATIDLENASNSLSLNLLELFPTKWKEWLYATRVPNIEVPRLPDLEPEIRTYEMAAPNGNGWIFEVQTVFYLAVCLACADDSGEDLLTSQISVYGDDIIVPTAIASRVIETLRKLGFLTNERKSYYGNEYFRESCGAHYFRGIPMKGVNIDVLPTTDVEWISLCNRIRAAFCAVPDWDGEYRYWYSPIVRAIWRGCINQISPENRLWGPSKLGDAVLHGPTFLYRKRQKVRYTGNKKSKDSGTGLRCVRGFVPRFHESAMTSLEKELDVAGKTVPAYVRRCLVLPHYKGKGLTKLRANDGSTCSQWSTFLRNRILSTNGLMEYTVGWIPVEGVNSESPLDDLEQVFSTQLGRYIGTTIRRQEMLKARSPNIALMYQFYTSELGRRQIASSLEKSRLDHEASELAASIEGLGEF